MGSTYGGCPSIAAMRIPMFFRLQFTPYTAFPVLGTLIQANFPLPCFLLGTRKLHLL